MSSFSQFMQPVFVVMIVVLLAVVVHQKQDSKTNSPSGHSDVDPEIVSRFLAEFSKLKTSEAADEHHASDVKLSSATDRDSTHANEVTLQPAEPRNSPTFETPPSSVHSVQKAEVQTIADSSDGRRGSAGFLAGKSASQPEMIEPNLPVPKTESVSVYESMSALRGQFCLNGQIVQCFESGSGEISLRWPNRSGINENAIPVHSQVPCRNCRVVATVNTSRGRGQLVCHKCNCSFLFVFWFIDK